VGDDGLAGLTSPVTQRLGDVVIDCPLAIREGRASNVGGLLTETSGGNPDLDYLLPRGGGHRVLSVGSECCVGPLPAGSYFGRCGLVVLSDEVGVCGAELIHTPFKMTETFHTHPHSSGGLLAVHPHR
jgi:hypothetical protein